MSDGNNGIGLGGIIGGVALLVGGAFAVHNWNDISAFLRGGPAKSKSSDTDAKTDHSADKPLDLAPPPGFTEDDLDKKPQATGTGPTSSLSDGKLMAGATVSGRLFAFGGDDSLPSTTNYTTIDIQTADGKMYSFPAGQVKKASSEPMSSRMAGDGDAAPPDHVEHLPHGMTRTWDPGTQVTTEMRHAGKKIAQRWTVGPDGRPKDKVGDPLPMTPDLEKEIATSRAAGKVVSKTSESPATPSSAVGPTPTPSAPARPGQMVGAASAAAAAAAAGAVPPSPAPAATAGAPAKPAGAAKPAGGAGGASKALSGLLGAVEGAAGAPGSAASTPKLLPAAAGGTGNPAVDSAIADGGTTGSEDA